MILYRYVKNKPRSKLKIPKLFPVSMIIIGFGLLIWVSWPIISFNILSKNFLTTIITPLSEDQEKILPNFSNMVLAVENSNYDNNDYTNADMWYPAKPQIKNSENKKTYMISIPSLNIYNAEVIVGGDSLEKSLIHYGGTSLPGEYGNTIIFGHSTLPALFNPKDYKTIFSNLPKLKPRQKTIPGDVIFITYDGITYRYEVFDMTITKPSDLSPLEQKFDDSIITLITCVPPGTYWERLNVKAKLVPPQ